MERTAVYEIELSGMKAEVIIDSRIDCDLNGMDITVKIGGKKLTESTLGPLELEALKRFFTE